ncbi:hypothetical protein QYE76_059388 [Lolium multiflorum]|uniref:RNase H type-1 domain-containing protein n=1 Tax=Lolium multiflorum TaxID=4521 RepID=A0AAD8W3A2_LOLMU|nr:hypothetical protein QYE76_059388 [Lolium multiflorum]
MDACAYLEEPITMTFGKFRFGVNKEGSYRLEVPISSEFSAVDSNFSSSDEEFSSPYFVDNKASRKLAKIFSNTSFESSADSFISSDSDSVDFNFIDKSDAIGKTIRSKSLDQDNRHSSYPLVAQQVMNQCDAVNESMIAYKEVYNELEKLFDGCEVNHISRMSNDEADVLANIGSQCLAIPPGVFWEEISERSTKPAKAKKEKKRNLRVSPKTQQKKKSKS